VYLLEVTGHFGVPINFQSLIYHLFPYSGLKQFARLICRNGAAEIIALPLVASMTLEEVQLLPSFHALCDYPLL
jgi:hypothetical protein